MHLRNILAYHIYKSNKELTIAIRFIKDVYNRLFLVYLEHTITNIFIEPVYQTLFRLYVLLKNR